MKKIVSLILVILLFTFATVPTYAANTTATSAGTVSPHFIGIAALSVSLNINSSGCANSLGSVTPSNSSYKSYLTVSLQQYSSGSWITVKSWNGSGSGLSGVIVSGSYYVGSGSYRTCATASVYNSGGTLVDSATAYSGVMGY